MPFGAHRTIALLDAPSDLGLQPTGVRRAPQLLRSLGLERGLPRSRHAGVVEAPPYDTAADALHDGVRNAARIRAYSARLADRVGALAATAVFPLVLGGDCSILLGTALAMRRHGTYGLVFLDGHADYYSPESEPNGELASMELAVVTGRGPAALADLEGLRPLVREEHVALLGFRDADSAAAHGSPDVRTSRITVLDLGELRGKGPAAAARDVIATLEEQGVDGFWVHLDADVLHDDVMPAVDYRMPDGLLPTELAEVLAVILASPTAVGMTVTIYNPSLDDVDFSAGRALVSVITEALAPG